MTKQVIDIDGALNKSAIYTVDDLNPSDRTPLTDPYSNLSRVKFHSNFRYPRIIDDRSGSIFYPGFSTATATPNRAITTTQLFAHGQSGLPFIIGAIFAPNWLNQYTWGPLGAGTPVHGDLPRHQVLSLGVTATHVVLRKNNWMGGNSGANAATIQWRVLVTNELLT